MKNHASDIIKKKTCAILLNSAYLNLKCDAGGAEPKKKATIVFQFIVGMSKVEDNTAILWRDKIS